MPETMTPTQRPDRTAPRQPGEDRPVAANDDLTILQALRAYKDESDRAKRTRMWKNKANNRAYMGEQDFSHKQKGQSREFLPKVPMAVEQFSGFIKKATTGYGDWFDVEVPPGPLSNAEARRLLTCLLGNVGIKEDGNPVNFATRMADGVKVGTLGSLMIFKVHGRVAESRRYRVERGLELVTLPDGQQGPRPTETLRMGTAKQWRLLIDLIRPEDYYPDPSGRGLYEMHEVERDLADVRAWADAGIYDKDAVARIEEDFDRMEEEAERERARGQDPTTPPGFRKRVLVTEFWGTLLDSKGHVVKDNCLVTMANDRYIIRKPTDNPYWHGQSPFVAIPLIRVPFSTWHKALADHMTSLNLALNELYNLVLDSGIASVWGVRQLRSDWLEDPRAVSDGIPQGATLAVNAQCPPGQKVLEQVTTANVSQEALAVMQMTDREFTAASLSNEIRMGGMPSREVKATAVVEASQSIAVTMDGLIKDMEDGVTTILQKAWMVSLQYAEDLDADDVVGAIGARGALALARMSPAQRFAAYYGCKFKVFGLSAVLNRVRDFQKIAALLQMVSGNPILLQTYVKRYSLDKTLDYILKTLNIDPLNLTITPEEAENLQQRMQELPMFMDAAGVKRQGGTGPGGGMAADQVGEPSLPAEVNQMANPMTGMTG